MIFCVSCGNKNVDTVKFCTSCGKPLSGTGTSSTQGGGASTQKVGTVHKCPNCGSVVESFQSRCTSCDFELNSIKASSALQAFVKKLDRANTYTEQREIIEAFPIPNTKEDIFEFAILAVTKIKPEGSKTNSAWITKMKQIYLKAQLVFAEDKSSLEKFKSILEEAENLNGPDNTSGGKKKWLIPVVIIAVVVVAVIVFFVLR